MCVRGQAALQGVYNPDRVKTPLLREDRGWRPLTFSEAEAVLKERVEQAARDGRCRVHIMSETVGESLMGLFAQVLEAWGSDGPVVFEPYAYES